MKNLTVVVLSVLILFFIGCDTNSGSSSDGSSVSQIEQKEGFGTIIIGLPGKSRSVPIADIKANASRFEFIVYNDSGTKESLEINNDVDNAVAEFYIPAGTYRVLVIAKSNNYIGLATGNAIDVVVNENQVTNVTITLMNISYTVTINNFPAQVTCGNEYTLSITPEITQDVTGFGIISSVYDNTDLVSYTNDNGTFTRTLTAPTSPGTKDTRIVIGIQFIDPYYSTSTGLGYCSLYNYNYSPSLNDDVSLPSQIEFITGSTPTGMNIDAEWGF